MTYPIGMERRYGYVLPLATESLEATATVSFADPVTTVEEGATATITVVKTGAGAASVTYSTADATATAGVDYISTSGTLTWADGELAPKTFTVEALADGAPDGAEYLTLTLSNPAGATLGALAVASLVILDPPP